jgi:hypothetical protein
MSKGGSTAIQPFRMDVRDQSTAMWSNRSGFIAQAVYEFVNGGCDRG